jgi:hypothetical protein
VNDVRQGSTRIVNHNDLVREIPALLKRRKEDRKSQGISVARAQRILE